MTLIHENSHFLKLKKLGQVAEGLDVAMCLAVDEAVIASVSGQHQTPYILAVSVDNDDDVEDD